MDDDFRELYDTATYLTMGAVLGVVMVVGLVANDTRIILIGSVIVVIPVTFAIALLRHAWNERSRRRPGAVGSGSAREPTTPPTPAARSRL